MSLNVIIAGVTLTNKHCLRILTHLTFGLQNEIRKKKIIQVFIINDLLKLKFMQAQLLFWVTETNIMYIHQQSKNKKMKCIPKE